MKEIKGPQIFEIGGCVRDRILGLDSKDIDFTFVLPDSKITVEEGFKQMTEYLEKEGYTIFLSVPEMFTIRAKFPKGHKFEKISADFVMARKEVGYIKGTRRPKLEIGTLEDDLLRRDFTMNAIAQDIDGKLIDPFKGKKAIKDKIIDTPQDPEITFSDDPLRILRAMRFSITKGFTMSFRIQMAIFDIKKWEKMFEVVSIERIREELNKMFEKDTVKTLRMIQEIDSEVGGFVIDNLFKDRMFLKPTIKG